MDGVTLENGLTQPALAQSLARVYYMASRGLSGESANAARDRIDNILPNAGWHNAAAVLVAMYAASDENELSLTYKQIAETMRTAVQRGLTGSPPDDAFESRPAREQLAWEVVGRCGAALTQLHDEDVRDLGSIELFWADKAEEYARNRGVTLEQPAAEE